MRRLVRPELEKDLASYLERMQETLDRGGDLEAMWKAQRASAAMRRIERVLAGMAGRRERCMYCEDSRGTDIEHYRPQRRFPGQAFSWLNLLLICSGCNRCKGIRFEVDLNGQPLLINPTAEDPWEFLYFEPQTGEITARWDRATGNEDTRGQYTLQLLAPLRYESVTEGRRRIWRNLRRAIDGFLARARQSIDAGEFEVLVSELLEAVSDNLDYGLGFWCFLRDGSEDTPFRELKLSYPAVWERVVESLKGLAE